MPLIPNLHSPFTGGGEMVTRCFCTLHFALVLRRPNLDRDKDIHWGVTPVHPRPGRSSHKLPHAAICWQTGTPAWPQGWGGSTRRHGNRRRTIPPHKALGCPGTGSAIELDPRGEHTCSDRQLLRHHLPSERLLKKVLPRRAHPRTPPTPGGRTGPSKKAGLLFRVWTALMVAQREGAQGHRTGP